MGFDTSLNKKYLKNYNFNNLWFLFSPFGENDQFVGRLNFVIKSIALRSVLSCKLLAGAQLARLSFFERILSQLLLRVTQLSSVSPAQSDQLSSVCSAQLN